MEKEEPLPADPGLKVLTFGITPVMSTYLTAFVVGEYEFVEDKTPEGTLVRVFTPLGQKERGLFALEVGLYLLSVFNSFESQPSRSYEPSNLQHC